MVMSFLNTRLVLIMLRFIHVVSGVLWAGGAVLLATFVLPAARDEANTRYLRRLIWTRNLPRYLNVTLVLALLSGLTMYGNLTIVTQGAWARSHAGMAFGVGGALSIIAAVIASFVAAPAIHRALELANKQPSSAEISVESTRSLARYGAAMRLVAVLLTGTAALMAVARYL
jgi:uncharacterized membrane protein